VLLRHLGRPGSRVIGISQIEACCSSRTNSHSAAAVVMPGDACRAFRICPEKCPHGGEISSSNVRRRIQGLPARGPPPRAAVLRMIDRNGASLTLARAYSSEYRSNRSPPPCERYHSRRGQAQFSVSVGSSRTNSRPKNEPDPDLSTLTRAQSSEPIRKVSVSNRGNGFVLTGGQFKTPWIKLPAGPNHSKASSSWQLRPRLRWFLRLLKVDCYA
jgi:hypothetical protein